MMYRVGILCCLMPFVNGFILDSLGLVGSVTTVKQLDVNKYLGRWFQMYASQSVYATFEQNAYCVTADYSIKNDGSGNIAVLNSERLNSADGPLKLIHGYAVPSGEPAKLTVHLEGVPIPAPYWVIKLGPATFGTEGKYQYAVVTDNHKATLFVLARDPEVFNRDYKAEVDTFLHNEGFTKLLNKPVTTFHGDNCIYNDQHV